MATYPSDYISDAPCYWEVLDDGAAQKCADCGQEGEAREMYVILTPNGKVQMVHRACIEEDWLAVAKKMPQKF